MANITHKLEVAAWTASNLPPTLAVTRFLFSPEAYDTLHQWCVERTGRPQASIVLSGLSEIVAFLVPDIAYMEPRAYVSGGPNRLALYFLGDKTGDAGLSRRLRTAINLWLGVIYPDKDPQVRGAVAASAEDSVCWALIETPTALREHAGLCDVPKDRMLFDLLVARAVAGLAGRKILFATGEERELILRTPQSSPYGGIELVSFPPKTQPGGHGLYSEVITIKTATFPDRRGFGVHVLARPSMRNWGPITSYDVNASPARSLDLFMPSDDDGLARGIRHTSFRYKAIVDNWKDVHANGSEKQITARWESHRDERIVALLGRLVGAGRLEDATLLQPVAREGGLWILPRLAPGSGDRHLAGGSGVPWPDRLDIAQSLDGPLGDLGFARAGGLQRINARMPVHGPFHNPPDKEAAPGDRRAELIKTLAAIGNGGKLDLLVFNTREDAPNLVRDEVVKLLGAPDSDQSGCWTWGEGLTIRLVVAPAGPLSELLPDVSLTDAESAGKTPAQRSAMLKARQERAVTDVAVRMATHIAAARRDVTGVACAILEMPDSFMGHARDPYACARRELARQRVLPQVVLVGKDDKPQQKFRAAVGDWMRMLGVLPVFEEDLKLAPAALALIQRNASSGGIDTQAFPLAARVRAGLLECAIPGPDNEPRWQPYALAALDVFSGDYSRSPRTRDKETLAGLQHFFATALEQIDRHGQTLVLVEADTVSGVAPGLQNAQLEANRLVIGQRAFAPSDLPNSRLIRFTADDARLPAYYHLGDGQWPTGLFAWNEGGRTAYGLKKKPVSAKTTSWSSIVSRHLESGDNNANDHAPRRLAPLDEICIVIAQSNDDMVDLQLLAHRLRSVHAQYGDDTRLPFPLHELKLLTRAITG